jgi:hypothetical protein
VNPARAQRCDCGFDFASGQVKGSYVKTATERSAVDEAFMVAVLSLVCIGIILAPVALMKIRAADTPLLTKSERARLSNARAIAWAAMALWAFVLIWRLLGVGTR